MSLSYAQVAALCAAYLGLLFSLAYATERGWLPDKLIYHPITYIFSLGIFASAWSFYGIIDLARQFGYGALVYYIGTGALFLLAPLLLNPLIELARRYQINSMADLLVFRYHSHSVGGVVTLVMLMAMAPLLTLQMQAVADTIHILTSHNSQTEMTPTAQLRVRQTLALLYCGAIALFAMAYGSKREHHKGLVTVMAFESLFKMFGLVAAGFFAVFYVFDGMPGLDGWLAENPIYIEALRTPISDSSTHALLLIFVATAVSMPHIFHMTVVENPAKRNTTRIVTWAFPLFLLIMALPIFPILWSGYAIGLTGPAQYFPLSVPLAAGSRTFTLIAFVGGLSAATGAMVAISLAMTTMILNQWILPTIRLHAKSNIYEQLVWMRRVLIGLVLMGGYFFYILMNNRFNLTELALCSFIATLQLLPGIIAVAHWPRGNRRGFLAGLMVGSNIWFFGMMLPMIRGWTSATLPFFDNPVSIGIESWSDITLWSVGLNAAVFMLVSMLSKQSQEELYGAELCSQDELSHPVRMTLDIRSPREIIDRLSTRIGRSTAQKEVERALHRIGVRPNESRPYALRRLRDEVEANLSSLIGISMASEIMDRLIPYKVPETHGVTDINLIENRLNQVRNQLTGLAAELNNLRLYHRRTLEELPLATCSIGQDMEILMWNSAMTQLTRIGSDEVTGSHLENVPAPWGKLLTRFAMSGEPRFYKRLIYLQGNPHWITLHKASIPSSLAHQLDGQVILLEDVTELQLLERELVHSERLASVGRLAAGVAHEIGNPVTGIACLAQNLRFETDEEERLETAVQILSLTQRVSRIVQSLVSFSHAGQQYSEYAEVRPYECVQEAINLLSLQKEKKQVSFENRVPAEWVIQADSQRLIQVFINLLSNSRDASPEGSLVRIDGARGSDYVCISVTDDGTGIPAESKDRIFEPFFTTKEPGEGTGLGLAMVYSIVEDHKGSIEIESPVNLEMKKGTRFHIRLPLDLPRNDSKSDIAPDV